MEEAKTADWESPASSVTLAKVTHDELLRLARKILHGSDCLMGQFLNDAPRRPEHANGYLWENATPTEEMVALAIAEATLAIATLLASLDDGDIGTLGCDGLMLAQRLVPSSYFHALFVSYAEVTPQQAVEIWNQLLDMMCKSKTSLPGLRIAGEDNARVILQLDDSDV